MSKATKILKKLGIVFTTMSSVLFILSIWIPHYSMNFALSGIVFAVLSFIMWVSIPFTFID